MTYRELYQSALRMVSEDGESTFNEDYEDRAGYLLAAFCNESAPIERKYCEANGVTQKSFSPKAMVTLSDSFPFHEVFVPAAIYYLSAMLVSDENEALSDRFFALYTDAISSIQRDLPYVKQKIVNGYPHLT